MWLLALRLTFWAGSGVCEALSSPISGTPCHSPYGPFCPGILPRYTSCRLLSRKNNVYQKTFFLFQWWGRTQLMTIWKSNMTAPIQHERELFWSNLIVQWCRLGGSYPLNTVVCHTPQLVRWGLWCSTTDHQDRCWDSDRSSPSGLALGTYQDKTYRGADRHY